jgi:hypothetical protein
MGAVDPAFVLAGRSNDVGSTGALWHALQNSAKPTQLSRPLVLFSDYISPKIISQTTKKMPLFQRVGGHVVTIKSGELQARSLSDLRTKRETKWNIILTAAQLTRHVSI